MQLILPLSFTLTPAIPLLIGNSIWQEAGWATACLGFTKKVEVSQTLLDALSHFHPDDDLDQPLYDALWLTHHYLTLDPRPSLSFRFDFIHSDTATGQTIESNLRLHVEEKDSLILLGFLQDF